MNAGARISSMNARLRGPAGWIATVSALAVYFAANPATPNPHSAAVMASPPTITTTTAGEPAPTTHPTLTNSYRFTTSNPFRYYGGGQQIYATLYRRAPVVTLDGSGTSGNLGDGTEGISWRATALVNAQQVAIRVNGSLQPFRFIVDGQYVSTVGTTTASASGRNWMVLDFGSKASRLITCEGELNTAFDGMYVAVGDTVTTPTTPAYSALFLGDSFTSATGAVRNNDGYVSVTTDYLALANGWASGSGGTGYVNTLGGTRYKLADRMADVDRFTALNPDPALIYVAMGLNDLASSSATVQAEAVACLNAIRGRRPKDVIFVLTPWDTAAPGAVNANYTNTSNAIKAAAAGRGGVYVIDMQGVSFTKSDGTHPDPAGHLTLGQYISAQTRLLMV